MCHFKVCCFTARQTLGTTVYCAAAVAFEWLSANQMALSHLIGAGMHAAFLMFYCLAYAIKMVAISSPDIAPTEPLTSFLK